MAIPNRSSAIERMHKVLKKHYKPVLPSAERDLLQQMLFACILEYSQFDKAEAAFARVQQLSYDLNEIRVTTVQELSESLAGAVDAKRAAWNLKRFLHSIFEQQYAFDLEHLKKQNLGKTQSELAKHPGATPFVVSYVTQHALGGHSIPLNKAAYEVLYIAGAIDETERANQVAPGLERNISKKQGVEFASLLHQMAVDLMASPYSTKNRATLSEMNASAKDRLPKRSVKKKSAAKLAAKKVEPTPPPSPKLAAKKVELTPPPAAKSAAKKVEPKPAPAVPSPAKSKKPAPPPPVPLKKKPPAKKPTKKKALTENQIVQSLTRRKPR